MLELAVVGGSEFTLGFKLAGIRKIFDVEGKASEQIRKVMQDPNVGIMVIDDKTVEALDEPLKEDITNSVKPVSVVLSTKATQEELRKMIIKSIGVDLWSSD
ncbi:V-type ATP synthase subunit F [Candidatus Woesearchaeota archaeon]|nr:V-type ATP synthase subunit F [Candidatus Woesearchaeota archaeon]